MKFEMRDKIKFVLALIIFTVIAVSAIDFVLAAEIKLQYLPSGVDQKSPVTIVSWLYRFALGLVGIAVFGVIVYGAILYTVSAGNASKQADAKEWITSAIWGLILLFAAYLILWTINKDIVDFNKIQGVLGEKVSSIKGVAVGVIGEGGGGGAQEEEGGCGDNEIFVITGAGGKGHCQPKSNGSDPTASPGYQAGSGALSEEEARDILYYHNIQTKNSCPRGQTEGCVNFNGIKEETLTEIVVLSKQVGSENVFITAGTEGGHSEKGVYNHSNGYKFDVRPNSNLDEYIIKNYEFIGKRDDGADQYKSSSGAIYAREGNHWDVLIK